jgi:hypothetical protein
MGRKLRNFRDNERVCHLYREIANTDKLSTSFRARFMKRAGDNNARRFFGLCETFTQAVGTEAKLREKGEVLALEEFIPHRRQNSGVLLCFALVEYILGVDLDDKAYEDATFMDAYWAACDYVCWSNVSVALHKLATLTTYTCRMCTLITWNSPRV